MRRYEKDIEYLEQILKQRCPYCDYSLQKPYKSKRECGRCDFILHGNPKLTAYKEIIKEWTDRGIGACFVLIPLIIFELIKYFTPL